MALYMNRTDVNAHETRGDSATGRPHSIGGAVAENGPSPARSYLNTRIDGVRGFAARSESGNT